MGLAGITHVISFSSAVNACKEGAEWQMALQLLRDMPKSEVLPNVISFNSVISACEIGMRAATQRYQLQQHHQRL